MDVREDFSREKPSSSRVALWHWHCGSGGGLVKGLSSLVSWECKVGGGTQQECVCVGVRKHSALGWGVYPTPEYDWVKVDASKSL